MDSRDAEFDAAERVSVTGDAPRLSRRQFSELSRKHRRRMSGVGLVFVAGIFALIWVISLVKCEMAHSGISDDSPWTYILMASMIPFVFAGGALLTWLCKNSLLSCPQCHASLSMATDPFQALAMGRCPKCAAVLFEDESVGAETLAHSETILLRRDDLKALSRIVRRTASRKSLAWGVWGALLLLVALLSGGRLTSSLEPSLGATRVLFLKPLLAFPGIISIGWMMIVYQRNLHAARPCPHCSAEISSSGFAAMTGRCSNCGQEAVSDPFPGIAPVSDQGQGPHWTIPEFNELAKPRHDRLWVGCFIGAGLTFAGIGPFIPYCSRLSMSPAAGSGLYVFIMVVMLFLQIGGVFLWHWRSARGLRCPECTGELLQHYHLVISSCRCYRCGGVVLGHATGENRRRR